LELLRVKHFSVPAFKLARGHAPPLFEFVRGGDHVFTDRQTDDGRRAIALEVRYKAGEI